MSLGLVIDYLDTGEADYVPLFAEKFFWEIIQPAIANRSDFVWLPGLEVGISITEDNLDTLISEFESLLKDIFESNLPDDIKAFIKYRVSYVLERINGFFPPRQVSPLRPNTTPQQRLRPAANN